jgi:arylsulfatase A-like enzyme
VLISIDTLRADHVGSYGYERQTTPHLDAIAQDGIRFLRAYSPANWTLPAHMSVMTSQHPSGHGVVDAQFALGADSVSLQQMLRSAGYQTAAMVSWIYVGRKFGFARGFDRFDDLVDYGVLKHDWGGAAAIAETTTDAAIRWLQGERSPSTPIFLFVHYFDPHMDYTPPAPFDTHFDPDYRGTADGTHDWVKPYIAAIHRNPRPVDPRDREHMEALYDGEILYTDQQVERLLRAIDAEVGLDNALVVIMSDHGEEFDDHGSMEGHGWTLYEEILHVPLLMRLPNRSRAGEVIDDLVTLLDIGPTMLAAAGIEAPPTFEGRNLLTASDPDSDSRYLFAESDRFKVRRRAVRGPRFKLVHTVDAGGREIGVQLRNEFELFDLQTDPGEQTNLYTRAHPAGQFLSLLLRDRAAGKTSTPAPAPQLSEEELELLRSLGYVQ